MTSVLLAAIHHGELDAAPARAVITRLTDAELVERVVEVTDQPPLDEARDAYALRRWRRAQRDLEEAWRSYLGTATARRRLEAVGGEVLFRFRLKTSRRFAETAWLARQVETFVTAKHIAAWRQFAQTSEDELLVLESDATLQDITVDALYGFLNSTADPNLPSYVNLAGGLAHADIAVEHLVEGRDASTVTFAKPVTNTSCAYLLNRAFATDILAFIESHPTVLALGIDWLFNAYFLDANLRGVQIACVHAEPPVLGHGSLTGVTRSWHPDR